MDWKQFMSFFKFSACSREYGAVTFGSSRPKNDMTYKSDMDQKWFMSFFMVWCKFPGISTRESVTATPGHLKNDMA